MKSSRISKIWDMPITLVCILLYTTPCFGFSLEGNSKYQTLESVNVSLNEGSDWRPITRSYSPAPPTATIDGDVLFIQSTSQNCDITINIIANEGYTVHEQTVPASATGYFSISLDGLPSGTYTLTLRNPTGGFLYGYFTLN